MREHLRHLSARLLAAALITPPAPAGSQPRQGVDIYLDPTDRTAAWHAGWADARVAGDLVFVSGIVVSPRPEDGDAGQDAAFERAFVRLAAILAGAGVGLDDVVDVTAYLTDVERQTPVLDRVRLKHMRPPYAASTVVQVTRLIPPRAVAELRVIARKSRP